ncbi:hypothetical protein D3C84_1046110 [compost metagenome]
MTADNPHIAVNIAWIDPRFSTGNKSPAIIIGNGFIIPAPMPWTARNKTSSSIVSALPHNIEPSRNRTMPAANTFVRPNKSDNRPATGANTVDKII